MDGLILGVVLAGGQSRRFGRDKARALFDGRMLIDHAVAQLAPFCARVAIAGAARDGHDMIADRPAPGLGPLGGLAGALHHAAAEGFAGVLTVPCDTPTLPAASLAALPGAGAAILDTLPVCGWWPAALAPALDAHLAVEGDRSLRRWASAVGARRVAHENIPNLNTVDDLARLERRSCVQPVDPIEDQA